MRILCPWGLPGGASLPSSERFDGADVGGPFLVRRDRSGLDHMRLEAIFARYHFALRIRWAVGDRRGASCGSRGG